MLNQSFQGLHQQNWLQAATELEASGETYVIITVLGTAGSTPRSSGTKMVVSRSNIYATIGGGHLEFQVIKQARELIAKGQSCQKIESFQLGANLGQCCGGHAVILLETFNAQCLHLDIYGAGHVAHALVEILGQLPIKIRWIDSRADIFPLKIPSNVCKVVDEEPVSQVVHAKNNSAFLILTHNHQLDFELCQTIIKRDDAVWLGVIGSKTKSKKFQHRLVQRGFSTEQIQQMTCPVGLTNITGKLPMEVAVSIAGQLITHYQTSVKTDSKQQATQWKSIKKQLSQLQTATFANVPTSVN